MDEDSFVPASGTDGMAGGDCIPPSIDCCAGETGYTRFRPMEHAEPIFGSGRRREVKRS